MDFVDLRSNSCILPCRENNSLVVGTVILYSEGELTLKQPSQLTATNSNRKALRNRFTVFFIVDGQTMSMRNFFRKMCRSQRGRLPLQRRSYSNRTHSSCFLKFLCLWFRFIKVEGKGVFFAESNSLIKTVQNDTQHGVGVTLFRVRDFAPN